MAEETKIPTAEQLLRKHLTLGEVEFLGQSSLDDLSLAMKSFTKLHVEAYKDKLRQVLRPVFLTSTDNIVDEVYSLTNIK